MADAAALLRPGFRVLIFPIAKKPSSKLKPKRRVSDLEKLPEFRASPAAWQGVWLGRTNTRGKVVFRAVLRKRFTGGDEVAKKFSSVDAAVEWLKSEVAKKQAALIESASVVLTGEEVGALRSEIKRIRDAGTTIGTIVEFFFTKGPGNRKPIKLSEAIEMRISDLIDKKKKESYIAAQRISLKVFLDTIGDDVVFNLNAERLKAWLTDTAKKRAWGPLSLSNYHRDVSILFGFLARRKMIAENPMKDPLFEFVAAVKEKADAERVVQIYTPSECAKLLRAAMEMPHLRLLPRLIFQFFSGMRVDEIDRAGYEILRTSRIQLSKKDVAKNGDPRPIPFSAVFSAWLALIPVAERAGQIVDRKGLRNRLNKLHARAGVAKKANGPRHTFASHDLVAGGSAAKTREKIGHNEDSDVLFKHYISEVTEEQAAEFMSLRPPLDVVVIAPDNWRSKPRGPRAAGGGGRGMAAKVV